MMDKKIICIEMEKSVYYTIVDKFENLKNIANNINSKYIISQINVPISKIINNYNQENNINLFPIDDLNYVHYMILYNCNLKNEKDLYFFLIIENINGNHFIKFPELENKKIKQSKLFLDLIKNNINTNLINEYQITIANYKKQEKIYEPIKYIIKKIKKMNK